MIRLLPSTPDYADDAASQKVWGILKDAFAPDVGVCYYRHPVVRATSGAIPEFTVIARAHHPVILRVLPYEAAEIHAIDDLSWNVNGKIIDSPVAELDDCVVALRAIFDRERILRHVLSPRPVLAMPLISEHQFRFRENLAGARVTVIWADAAFLSDEFSLERPLTEDQWKVARSVVQGARPLSRSSSTPTTETSTVGEAIRQLEKEIALLDQDQERVAIPIAPGPQRIRGLAGTGKTVLLAMKAANIHLHFPDKKILFTFNTQSLYNQSKTLISKFYRYFSDTDPNCYVLHIRHAWGSRGRPGVYYDLCLRQGVPPLNLNTARTLNPRSPFQACCDEALKNSITQEYDFVLVDEAQDFPTEFFKVLYGLAVPP